jgi:hypothetical protein
VSGYHHSRVEEFLAEQDQKYSEELSKFLSEPNKRDTQNADKQAASSSLHQIQNTEQAVIRQIKRRRAYDSFIFLTTECDSTHLCHLLWNVGITYCRRSIGDFKGLFGCERDRLPTVIKRMRRCAKDIDRISAPLLLEFRTSPSFNYTNLPTHLSNLADKLQKRAKQTRERGRPEYDRRVAALANYVQERFQKAHHAHVTRVVAAMRGDNYSLAAHKDWRKRHTSLLARKGKQST